jgi:hypothetical protein
MRQKSTHSEHLRQMEKVVQLHLRSLYSQRNSPCINVIGGCMGQCASLDTLEGEINLVTLLKIERRFSDIYSIPCLLCRLRYCAYQDKVHTTDMTGNVLYV